MGLAVKVKMLLAAKDMSYVDLAAKMEPKTTAQNIGVKIRRDNLTERDLVEIARACGATYEGSFVLEDGRRI